MSIDFGTGDCLESGRIEIVRYLTPDGQDIVTSTVSGDAETAVIALGMLSMTSDTILHAPDQEDDQ